MPRPREEFDEVRPLEFRTPEAVLDEDQFYTVSEIGRLLQGLPPEEPLDPETENVLLDWAIPWMLKNADSFVFAEPSDEQSAGYYGLAGAAED